MFGIGIVALVLLAATSASAADRYVEAGAPYDPFNDCRSANQPCGSIANATVNAVAGDVIHVGAGTFREVLIVKKDLTLAGAGADRTTLRAGGRAVAMLVTDGASVTVRGLTVTGGRAGGDQEGGGLQVGPASRVRLLRSHVTGNAGRRGGGIYTRGDLVVRQSTVSANSASEVGRSGGGLYVDGATATIANSTISGNRAPRGGGLVVAGGGAATLRAVTLLQNDGAEVAAVQGQVTLQSVLVADDAGIVCSAGGGGRLGSAGYNLAVEGAGCPADGAGDQTVGQSSVFATVVEATLEENGGSTPTHRLRYDDRVANPALDAGTTVGPADQRGQSRAVDAPEAPNGGGDAADVGAVELTTQELPVELTAFAAVAAENGHIRLRWRTASETNNAGFRVERQTGPEREEPPGASSASSNWQPVGFVGGAGTTTVPQSYRFVDKAVPYAAGALMYRLRQVDTDGTASYTKPVTVMRGAGRGVRLLGTYPNPAGSRATVRLAIPDGRSGEAVRLRLYDVLGRAVRTVEGPAEAGRHTLTLDTSRLPSGVYLLRLRVGATRKTQKLTVVR